MSEAIIGVSRATLQWTVTCKARATTTSSSNANVNAKAKTVNVVKAKEDKQQSHKINGGFGEKNLNSNKKKKKMNEPMWQCVQNCGACCKLHKGPTFATPDEIFDNPSDIQLYNSLVGADGWCIHFDKSTKTCSIYDDRPYFCRVEPDVFQDLYGINKKKFNKEACSFCKDTIKAIYGADSEVLDRFNKAIRS